MIAGHPLNIVFIVPAPFLHGNGGFPPRHIPYYTLLSATNLSQLKNISVTIIDAYAENLSVESLISRQSVIDADIICVPYTHDHRDIEIAIVKELMLQLKSSNPSKTLVLYNRYAAELNASEWFDTIDYLLEGDYEKLFGTFIKNINDKEALKKINGVSFIDNNAGLVLSKAPFYSSDPDLEFFPDFDLLPMNLYRVMPHRHEGNIVYYSESAKGCHWGKCAYCQENMARIKGQKNFRSRTPKNIVEEIDYAIKRYGANEIMFNNAQFQVDLTWLHEFEAELLKKEIKIKWSALSRADFLSPEIIAVFKKTGCTNILVGIESVNEELCRVIDKNSNIKNLESGIKELKKAGIGVTGSFLIGLPGEVPKDAFKNMHFALKTGIDYAQIFIAKWNDLSALEPYKNKGEIMPHWHYAQFEFNGPVFVPSAYRSLGIMKFIQQLSYLYFYCHPLTLFRMARKIRTLSDFFRLCAGAITLIRINLRISKFSKIKAI